jgi:protein-tyrosine-phosphatase/predicted ATP-grasp superfamily ATP-dependent carboligase
MAAAQARSMSEIRVLVLDGHSRAALETVQSLGRAGVEVDLAAEAQDCLAMHSRYISRKLQQPSQERAAYFQSWLREQDSLRNYTLIVPATETSLLGLRQLDENDPLRRKAVIPGDEALDIALDKEKTWQLAHQLGIPTPSGVLLSSLSDVGQAQLFPVVLKPTHSKVVVDGALHTLAVAIVKSESERQEQLRRWLAVTPVQQQEYIQGRGVGVEFLFNRGRKLWHFAHERVHEYPLTGGASSYRRSINPPAAMLQDAQKLLTALHWHGAAMVEFKIDAKGQHWLMEINPRLWGSLALSIDAGVNFPLGLLQVAQGEEPAPKPKYKVPYYTRDFRTDVDWLKCNILADHHDPLLHTRSRPLSFLELLRPFVGSESWDHFDWRDLGISRKVLTAAVTDQLRPVYRKFKDWQTKSRLLRHHRNVLRRVQSAGGPRKILFLCYGNICRSPLAAALAEKRLSGITIDSAGFHEQTVRSCPQKILRIGKSFGIDLSNHHSARVTHEGLADADMVIAMDLENLNCVRQEFPEMANRTTLLGLFGTPGILAIADPYLADETLTNKICEQVRQGIEGLAAWVEARKPAASTSAIPTAAVGGR